MLVWIALIAWFSGDGFSDAHTAGWLARSLALLGLPPAWIGPANWILRKSAHFVEYAVLGLLTGRALGLTAPRLAPRPYFAGALGLALACALADELHQLMTLSRSGSLGDVVIDGAGATVGVLLAGLFVTRRAA